MCGIAGYIDFKQKSTLPDLEQMTRTLQHRGPDGEGFYFNDQNDFYIGLGHKRLSIIDLTECGKQPMSYDGLHLVFNGEIYNYAEIKEELIRKGHSFKSNSDTEVILHAVREWGLEAIQQWHGMFALVLFDEKANQVYVIRDRAGVKPLYYYWDGDLFIFGSELKAIMAHPFFPKKVSPDAVASFLQYGYVPTPHCIFERTYKLKPGYYLQLNLESRQKAVTQYWNVYDCYNKPKLNISFTEAKEETERILQKAFNYRMVADVPVGVFLSGGFDSTCVAAFLQKERTERIKTFTIGSSDKRYNEAPFAKEIAKHLGTDHTEYYCTPEETLSLVPQLAHFYDEPFADSSAVPSMIVSRIARERVTVALSADAGDEIFAGYSKYDYFIRYGRKLNRLPSFVRKVMVGLMNNISSEKIPYFKNTYNAHSRYEKLKGLLHDPSPSKMVKSASHTFLPKDINQLFTNSVIELDTQHSSDELLPEYYDSLSYLMAVDYQTYLTDDILQKVDRATMSASLEGREPYLDQDVIEWAAQLPSSFKYHNGEKKYILKQIVYKHIPKEMMDRPKMGFSIPMDKWLSNELKELVMDHLSENKLNHGLFVVNEVLKIRDAFLKGRTELYLQVWHLLMFQLWYERWMRK